jgi:hypothetical protein
VGRSAIVGYRCYGRGVCALLIVLGRSVVRQLSVRVRVAAGAWLGSWLYKGDSFDSFDFLLLLFCSFCDDGTTFHQVDYSVSYVWFARRFLTGVPSRLELMGIYLPSCP